MVWSKLSAVWGGDRARPRLSSPRVLLGTDADTVYVLGERESCVMLEAWSADTGARVNSVAVSRMGQLRSERVWRGERDELVVFAVRRLDRNEVVTLDVSTGSVWEEQAVPFSEHVMAASRGGAVRVTYDPSDPREAGVIAPGGSLRPEMRDGVNTYAVSADGALIASWNDYTGRLLVIATPPKVELVASTDARYDLHSPQMVFSDDHKALWCVSLGEVRCFALPSFTELGRWTGASRVAEIVGVSLDGRAVLLDGPIAFEVGEEAQVNPRRHSWAPHLARLSPDGTRLAHASGTLGWYDLAREKNVELHTGGHSGEVLSIACSPDGRRVATASRDRSIRVCEAATGECVWSLEGDAEGFSALCFSPDGVSLYAVTHGFEPRLTAWNLEDGVEVTPSRRLVPPPRQLSVTPDGRTLVIGCEGIATLRIDAASFELSPDEDELAGVAEPVRAKQWLRSPNGLELIAFSGDERADVSGRAWLSVRSFDASSLRPRRLMTPWLRAPLTACAVGDTLVAMGGYQGEVVIFGRGESDPMNSVSPLLTDVTALAFSPDESALYVGTSNGQVRVYALRKG